MAFGLLTLFFVPASPRDIRILTEEEREAYCRDLANDWSGDADTDGKYEEVFSWSEVASAFIDAPHVLILALPLFFSGVTVRWRCLLSCKILIDPPIALRSRQLVLILNFSSD